MQKAWKNEKCVNMLFGKPERKRQPERLAIDGSTLLKQIFNKQCEGVDQIQVPQE
jgi:hypothetical protein